MPISQSDEGFLFGLCQVGRFYCCYRSIYSPPSPSRRPTSPRRIPSPVQLHRLSLAAFASWPNMWHAAHPCDILVSPLVSLLERSFMMPFFETILHSPRQQLDDSSRSLRTTLESQPFPRALNPQTLMLPSRMGALVALSACVQRQYAIGMLSIPKSVQSQ